RLFRSTRALVADPRPPPAHPVRRTRVSPAHLGSVRLSRRAGCGPGTRPARAEGVGARAVERERRTRWPELSRVLAPKSLQGFFGRLAEKSMTPSEEFRGYGRKGALLTPLVCRIG